MKPELTSLKSWMDSQYQSYPNMSAREKKEAEAVNLGVGVATIYRWLKAGNVYIEFNPPSTCGDDSSLCVWKLEKNINE